MKSVSFFLAILFLIILSDNAFAQYPLLKYERIPLPWNSELKVNGNEVDISLTQEGKVVIINVPRSTNLPTFYFYDESKKIWSEKQLTEEKWKMNLSYNNSSFDFKTVLGYKEIANPKFVQGMKWIFNYGDSLLLDSIESNAELVYTHIVTPSLAFIVEYQFDSEFTYNNYIYKPVNVSLSSRNKYGDNIDTREILTVARGHKLSQNRQTYNNSVEVVPIDSESVIVGVKREYWTVPLNGDYTKEAYTLLLTKTDINRISDTITLPRRNNDGQFFLKRDLSTYLYSSPRHGIMSNKPENFGFIDIHLKNVEIRGEYANNKSGYYCLCNSKTEISEHDKFLIYSINNIGDLQKFSIPISIFEYPDNFATDSSVSSKEILYADDTIMYVEVTTRKIEKGEYFFSQPQLYKIYLKETVNSVAEQPAITPLQIYPNPTDQTLHWNTASGTAIISDALGRTLLEVPASAMEADVSALAVGVYFLTIRNGAESVVRTFVVMR